MKKVLLLVLSLTLLISCKEKTEQTEVNSTVVSNDQLAEADVKKVALNIEGMTCEIGCARTIQSKLSKKEGVKFAEVNFEKKKGIVEFDVTKISEKEIVETVEQIAGGDLYQVTEISATK